MRNNLKIQAISAFLITLLLLIVISCSPKNTEKTHSMKINQSTQEEIIRAMVEKFGDSHRTRIQYGVHQVAARWQESDGSEDEFKKFCLKYFVTDPAESDHLFGQFQKNLEALYGNLHRISRQFDWAMQVDEGPVYNIDYLFANFNPFAHVSDDAFDTKIAFVALLNYSLPTLREKNEQGMQWSRRRWAEVRLAEEFIGRVPAKVAMKRSQTYTAADDYINNYNIYMHHLLDEKGRRLFPEGLKLISHWGLRDELKAQYANPDGFARQKMIRTVMERIIRQEIPRKIINNNQYDWNPFDNVLLEQESHRQVDVRPEPDTRYQHILNIFQAEKLVDPYYPETPSLIDRRFHLDREMSEAEVESILKTILTAPVLKQIAGIIQKRLGRPLEPFDIWYDGLKSQSRRNEAELDKIVSQRYPSVKAFQHNLPNILQQLGFTAQKAHFLAQHIRVDPSRGAGHASGAMMKDDQAHLRTRIPEGGMNYKGYNIAIHELGHNVEQVFSLNEMDYYTLHGVPNTAFTEAFAFVFQSRDLNILGLRQQSDESDNLRVLNDLWATMEISGVALTDMYIWRWMYQHPNSDPGQLKAAVISIAKQVWNDYFAPVIGQKDSDLLAIYSHIVDGAMYTPDYPLGQIISFQIEQYLKTHDLASDMERMCKLGRLSPQIWMQQAVGRKVSATSLLKAAQKAIRQL